MENVLSMTKPPVPLSGRWFLAACAVAATVLLAIGRAHPFPTWLMPAEIAVTVAALFILGSTRRTLDKNALTAGSALVVAATFIPAWWPGSALRADLAGRGAEALASFLSRHLFRMSSLNELVHADTMLFIFGLTFFVAVIAQTRLLENVGLWLLAKSGGRVAVTVAALAALVSVASGVLAGVSMVGLMIRTLIIILAVSKTEGDAAIFAVMMSTVVTTVCGMWMAYGEPPNLLMKANLSPVLDDAYFLRYCLPAAIGTYVIVLFHIRSRLKGRRVEVGALNSAPPLVQGRAQIFGVLSFVPFIVLLILHGLTGRVALYVPPLAGLAVASLGIASAPAMRRLALKEAVGECAEYLFLLPLFFSVALLGKSGFFAVIADGLHHGIASLGATTLALVQYAGAALLSALLDNNVVADVASRALSGLETGVVRLFSTAQIAGYAAGGCWTHIGSAQSIIAYAFIRRELDAGYTPWRWIRAMTPIIFQISLLMAGLISLEGLF
jgi:Na+/H+ antiporter NhaD/arsenite permease-like protein